MSELPPRRYASYQWHIVSHLSYPREAGDSLWHAKLRLVRQLDQALDLLESEPRFPFLTLPQTIALDDYLTLRPENFERIERLIQAGKLIVGPFYVQIDPASVSPEAMIRNLLVGLQTARIFNPPTQTLQMGFQPDFGIPAHLPQIYQGFGIQSVIVVGSNYREAQLKGDDGTSILAAQVKRATQPIHAAHSLSGHVLALSRPFAKLDPLANLDRRTANFSFPDRVFQSNPMLFAQKLAAFDAATPLPTETVTKQGQLFSGYLERLLTHWIEPFGVWYDNLPDEPWKLRPQVINQQLWRGLFQNNLGYSGKPTEVNEQRRVASLREIQYSASALREVATHHTKKVFWAKSSESFFSRVFQASAPEFQIMACKLPEDADRGGVIVRGCNKSNEERWVKLTPWRAFAAVEVVTLDESPTGGKLAVGSDGTFEFKAGSKRILTFWLHD